MRPTGRSGTLAGRRQLWTSLHHQDGSGTVAASRNGTTSIWVPRANKPVPTRVPASPPGGTAWSLVAVSTRWPGHPNSSAP